MYGQQWHYPMINMPAAWDRTTGNSSLVIAVVDTGVRFDHPDLQNRLSPNGYDFIDNDNNPTDPNNGHGTHTSGTIGAATNNSVGVAGMTWSGTILPVRTLGTDGGTHFQFSQGFRYAAGLLSSPDPVNPTPAAAINYSGGGGDSTTKKDAVAAVNAANVVIVCSTGNNNGAVGFPAAYSLEYPYVIAVGATNYGNGSPTRAYYSNYGPSVNVVAPRGGDTTVDSDGDGNVDGVLSTAWNYGTNLPTYAYWMGTSMAAPHVTGLVALMLGQGYPADLVRTRLQDTATDLGSPGFDNEYGWGLINAELALPPGPVPSVSEGTIGTELTITGFGFGDKKGKVLIGNVATKVTNWTDTGITCTVKKVPLPIGPYTVSITSKAITPITLTNAFTVKDPEIDTLTDSSGASGDEIRVTDNFFGIKKGKVYLEWIVRARPKTRTARSPTGT
jgi:serine protease